MMNDYAIDRIYWFMNLPEFQPHGFESREDFEEHAYVRWTANELLMEIMDHPFIPADDTMMEMWFRMLFFYHEAPSPRARRQFLAALNTLDTINALL